MNEFKEELNLKVKETYDLIKTFLPKEEGLQKRVFESMNYSFESGGKRLRPLFMLESYRLFGGTDLKLIAPFMAAIEMVHTYSLIHDDLPAMDNDNYRRGRLTNHKMFDEATAILAGDGLLNFAFETINDAMNKEEDFTVLKRMASASYILSKKTAALIEASLMIGALLAGASIEEVKKMEKAGNNIGLAFQIQDDILDITGDFEKLGKSVGSDEKNEKTTYVSINGLEKSEADQKILSIEAIDIIDSIAGKETFLSKLTESLITRNS